MQIDRQCNESIICGVFCCCCYCCFSMTRKNTLPIHPFNSIYKQTKNQIYQSNVVNITDGICFFYLIAEYQTLKLMQLSISKINDVCQSLLDNLQLDKLIPSPPLKRPPLYSAKGIKNTRRHMEDRHIIIDDFNSVFGIKVMYNF